MKLVPKIERHRNFLDRGRTDRPLVGCILGWESLSRYVPNTEALLPKGLVDIADLSWERFLPVCRSYTQPPTAEDDLFRTVEPLPFFPWIEAAGGCPIRFTGQNFWSGPQTPPPGAGALRNRDFHPWIQKYGEYLSHLACSFADRHPLGQSILRGPLDLAAALFGDEKMVYLFFDDPGLMEGVLDFGTRIFLAYLEMHQARAPLHGGGRVIGQYYIWTPGTCLRLQEDAMALISPDLYKTFVDPRDRLIAAVADTSLFHLHSTGLHCLDCLLANEGIDILQVSKDEGVELSRILGSLRRIQEAGRCLILKGKFSRGDLDIIKRDLDYRGLCIQAVVKSPEEADAVQSAF